MIRSYEEAVAYLDDHIGRGMHPGLTRITELLEMMGDPQTAYPVVHVAGTNGKTSVARMTTMLLVAHGLATGTFTSPHLEVVEERLALNGVTATPEQFVQATADLAAFADLYEERSGTELSYFELTAAMAFAWFADQAADAAVIEVGLGGRLDATNAAHAAVAVLTSVGLEHQEYLGDTLEEIAGEKLAIVEDGAVLVTGPLQPELDEVVRQVEARHDLTVLRYGVDFHVEGSVRAVGGWMLDVEGTGGVYQELHLPLHGRHQTINLAVAIAAAEALIGHALDPEAVSDATQVMSVPGRLEPVEAVPPIMLDGAHNPHGFAALGATLAEEFPAVQWVLVVGMLDDKPAGEMISRIRDHVSAVVTSPVPSPRTVDADDLADQLRQVVAVPVESADSPSSALEAARALTGPEGRILVAGSLYLVGAIRALVQNKPPPHPNER